MSQIPNIEEVVYELDNIALSKATSINGVMVQMWDRKVLTAYVEQKLHQQLQKAQEEERERINKMLVSFWREERIEGRTGRGSKSVTAVIRNNLLIEIQLKLKALDHSELDQPNVLDQCPDHYIAGHNEGYNKHSCKLDQYKV